jgi:Raf kinase inhibitor-like YbhB/YbcL family protein
LVVLVLALGALAGCSSSDGAVENDATATRSAQASEMSVTSSAFADGGVIPTEYTCAGAGRRPDLSWSAPPKGTKELALLVFDPDAGSTGFVHYLVWGVDPSIRKTTSNLYPGGLPGMNGRGSEGWVPPCPPSGGPHHYEFTVFALSQQPEIAPTANVEQFLDAIKGSVLAEGRLTGTFGR